MKRPHRSKLSALLASLLLMPAFLPAQAGEDMTGSEQSAFSVAVLVAVPVFSVGFIVTPVVMPSIEASDASTRQPAIPHPAPQAPPETMRVAEVTRTAEGHHQVILQAADVDPDDLDPADKAGTGEHYRASLTWPAFDIDPTSAYTPGEIIHFTASRGGSGWLISNAGKQPIGFLPNASIQQQAYSQTWP